MPTADCIPITAVPGLSRLISRLLCRGGLGAAVLCAVCRRGLAAPARRACALGGTRGFAGGTESVRQRRAGHRVIAAGRRRGRYGAAGGALRRSAVHARSRRPRPSPGRGRPRPPGIRTPPFSGWPAKITISPRSITSPFRPAASCASWSTRRPPKLRGPSAAWCWTSRSRRSLTRPGSFSVHRMRWMRWRKPTSPAAHSRRRSRISMRRSLRRRDC